MGLAEKDASARVSIFEGPTTTQPQAEASAEASPKLSYLEVERKILDSCIKGTKCAGEVGGRKVIWG